MRELLPEEIDLVSGGFRLLTGPSTLYALGTMTSSFQAVRVYTQPGPTGLPGGIGGAGTGGMEERNGGS